MKRWDALFLAASLPAAAADMVAISAGPLTMGSDDGPADERPAHGVTLTAFLVDRYPVTNSGYADFLNAAGTHNAQGERLFDFDDADARVHRVGAKWAAHPGHEKHPVVEVTWTGARDYCAWAGKRLPTEAEWEKAARGGLEGARFAWGDARPSRASFDRPPRVTDTPANPLGIAALSGVCHEWCLDWEDPGYYAVSPERNPVGPADGRRRVSRGGAWRHHDPWSPVAHRSSLPPALHYSDYGFRVVRGGADHLDVPIRDERGEAVS